ncbi:hypothetical protein PM082_024244 [Marasmius tenuissimus]|nr:hypothetical protein PM082_024244 [Marasmius tenuissimus]
MPLRFQDGIQTYMHHYNSSRHRTLVDLPNELIDEIAFHAACPELDWNATTTGGLLGLPCSLTSLLLTCKRVYSVLVPSNGGGGGAVWRRIFRYKFSSSAVERRFGMAGKGNWARKTGTRITSSDYHFQLKLYVRALRDVQHRAARLDDSETYNKALDEPILSSPDDESQSIEELMWVLWVMCLEDDGINRLQLDFVGAYGWVEAYIHRRLNDGAEENGGWPLDNAVNSCALHIFWYLTTKERLFLESSQSREEIVRLVLPYVTGPFRYTSTFVPPNHFRVPLSSEDPFSAASNVPSQDSSFSIDLAKPTPGISESAVRSSYPVYLSPNERTWNHIFYNRRIPMTIPLITEAAKLVYAARRELWKIHVPEARFSRTRWEFNQLHGYGPSRGRMTPPREVMPTLEDFDEFNDCLLGGEAGDRDSRVSIAGTGSREWRARGGGTALTRVPAVLYRSLPSSSPLALTPSRYSPLRLTDVVSVDESPCQSRDWDKDWQRLRSCLSWSEEFDTDSDVEGDEDVESLSGSEDDSNHENEPCHLPESSSTTTYGSGDMAGLWAGKLFLPSETHFSALLNGDRLPLNFNEGTLGPLVSVPVYMRLREYRLERSGGNDPRPPEGPMSNGWFPWGTTFRESEGRVVVSVPAGSQAGRKTEDFVYRTALPTDDSHLSSSIDEDTILIGQTDPRHGDAWHPYRFFGRVRRWDGCVCLIRVPLGLEDDDASGTSATSTTTSTNATTPTTIRAKPTIMFYGSLVGGERNFVGNWRVASPASSASSHPDADWEWSPQWEGGISLGKRAEW